MGGRGSKGGARGDGRRVYRREPGDWLWANRAFWTVALLALSALLSAFRFVTLPQGGSVTFLSLLPLWLVTYFYGPRHGCVAGAVFGFTRLVVIFGVGEWVNFSPGAIVLEYPVACGAVAVGGLLLRGFGPRRGRECGCGRGAGRGSGARDEGEEDDDFGVAGLVVPPMHSHALADALELMCRRSDLRHDMAIAGKKRIRKNHVHQDMVDHYNENYKEVISKWQASALS